MMDGGDGWSGWRRGGGIDRFNFFYSKRVVEIWINRLNVYITKIE